MGKEDRDWYRGEHPPTCSCADCTRRRVHGDEGWRERRKREQAERRAKAEQEERRKREEKEQESHTQREREEREREREDAERRAKEEQKRKEGMKPSEDYYDVLQVSPHAVPEVIEGAYRKLAKKIHDEHMAKQITFEEMNKRLTQLNCAHDVLSDPAKRRDYHQEWLRRQPKPPYEAPRPPPPPSPANIVLSDFSISPQQVELGSSVTISITATNHGGTVGSKTIAVLGDFIRSQSVTLNPGASIVVSFTVEPTAVGSFSITVGSFTGRFVVKAPPRKPIPVAAKWFAGLLVLAIVIGLSSHFWPTNTPATVPTPAPTSTLTLTPTPTSIYVTPTPTPAPIHTPTPPPTPKPTPSPVSLTPIITNVSSISATRTQTITIEGVGFGKKEPYNGNSRYIEIVDVTSGWSAGHDANWIQLNVAQWTDGQIIISGFTGAYTEPNRVLHAGDEIQVKVWNAQSGLGPAVYTVICGPN